MFCSNKLPHIESRIDVIEYNSATSIQELNKAFSISNNRFDNLEKRLSSFSDTWHPVMTKAIKDDISRESASIKEFVSSEFQLIKKEFKGDLRRLREEMGKENKKNADEINRLREEIRLVTEKTDTDMKRLRQDMESGMRSLREEMKGGNNNETHISA